MQYASKIVFLTTNEVSNLCDTLETLKLALDRTKSGQNALVCRVKAPDTIATEVSKLLLPMLARMTGWNASGLNTEQAHLLTQPRGQA